MKRRTRNIIIFTVLIILIAAAITITAIAFSVKKDGLTVKELGKNDLTQNSVSDYKDSRLNLYKNGTFDVLVIYIDQPVFAGQGTYEIRDDTYYFTYLDCWTRSDNFEQDPDGLYVNKTHSYGRKGSRIEFTDHNHQIYYFG